MKKVILLLLFISASFTFGQVPDSLKNKWIPSFVVSAGINQIAFTNWVRGGDNSIAWMVFGDFHYDLAGDIWSYKNSIKAVYGRSKVGSSIYKTTDNDLYIENVAIYNFGWAVSPFVSNSIRSSVAPSYNYKVTPEVESSNLFDPGYVTQTIGFIYDKYPNIVTRLGIGFQEVFASSHKEYTDPVNMVDGFIFETGVESVTDINYKLADNILFQSKIRLFSQFKSLDVWDVRLDNMISAQITKIIAVNFTYLVVYEKAQSPLTQVKEGLQIGINYRLL